MNSGRSEQTADRSIHPAAAEVNANGEWGGFVSLRDSFHPGIGVTGGFVSLGN
jgi:hypothetical protein